MVRSIQVFRYEEASAQKDILNVLKQTKDIKYASPNKSNKSKTIELRCDISDIKEDEYGISGHFFFRYQEKINRYMPDEKYAIWGENYNFLIAPKAGIIIIHGSAKFRRNVRNLLSQVIHDGLGYFKEIIIHKDAMMDLVRDIIKDNTSNNVERPKFDYLENKYNDWTELDFATGATSCVTNHKDFAKYFNPATLWSPKMRVKKCAGIVEEEPLDYVSLSMKYDASFTLSHDASPKEWNKFVFEKCKKPLGLR